MDGLCAARAAGLLIPEEPIPQKKGLTTAAESGTIQDVMKYTEYMFGNKTVTKRFVSGISQYADASGDGAESIAEAFAALRCDQPISDEAQRLVEDFIERWRKNGT